MHTALPTLVKFAAAKLCCFYQAVNARCPISPTRHSLWLQIRRDSVAANYWYIFVLSWTLHCLHPSLQPKECPLCFSNPICQDHSFQIRMILSGGGVCLWRRLIIKADEKPKCRWSLISWGAAPPTAFSYPFISWSHFPFIQGLLGVLLTPSFFYTFCFLLISTLCFIFSSVLDFSAQCAILLFYPLLFPHFLGCSTFL